MAFLIAMEIIDWIVEWVAVEIIDWIVMRIVMKVIDWIVMQIVIDGGDASRDLPNHAAG
jgi:hypothetical protein